MSARCRSIQELLVEGGPTALQNDDDAQQHLVDCERCYAFLEALAEVDSGLLDLDAIDAPDALVERAIAAARSTSPDAPQPEEETETQTPTSAPRRSRWSQPLSRIQILGSAAAATLVLLTSWSLLSTQQRTFDSRPSPTASSELKQGAPATAVEPEALEGAYRARAVDDEAELRADLEATDVEQLRGLGYAVGGKDEVRASGAIRQPLEEAAQESNATSAADALSELANHESQSLNQRANEAFGYLGERSFSDAHARARGAGASIAQGWQSKRDDETGRFEASPRGPTSRDRVAAVAPPDLAKKRIAGDPLSQSEVDAVAPSREGSLQGAEESRIIARPDAPRSITRGGESGESPAERFARERRVLENLRFQPASGYWENTYVPGDPVMRWLEARLAQRDRKALQAVVAGPLQLEAAARQATQPFDPPTTAALSVFLHADRRGIEGETRMLVQVGLRGADRHSGLRPAMNVGIVLDLRGEIAPETAGSMRALVHAFLAAKDVGDHFSLIAAGKPGGTWVAADDFRHGPITVALSRLESPARGAAPEPVLGLEQAVERAVAETKDDDDPTAPLGSSLVLLVTSQPLGTTTDLLEGIAHRSAVAGVPLSVVGVGDGISLDEIDRISLAGQGNRRLMHAPPDADGLVARELSALSRVIARALRLRIRLAPGVELVDVVGAGRLDAAGANRVRQAEKSIDRRLSRNLGIEADRGEDEEGIQIVIPTFYSGDAHSVVLDVVARGPGPIADVTVRYKDLVYLRNGVTRANLTVGLETASPGPLERNVVKSYLAIRLSDTLKQAGRELLAGRDPQAISLVRDFYALLESLSLEVPGYQNDRDIETDLAMLREYLAVLETDILQQSEPRYYLADSLQLSGYLKTVPRSASDSGDADARAVRRR